MQETWNTIVAMFEQYIADSWYVYLLGAALLFLLITCRKRKVNGFFLIITLLFALLYFWPVTARIIMKNFIGRSVYWRMLWVLPAILIIAWAGVSFLGMFKKKWMQNALFAFLAAAVILGGTCMYFQGNYSPGENLYKLPAATVPVCDMISEDAEENGIEQVKVLVPNDLLCYIRQYEASFLMPYGRNAFKYEDLTQNQAGLFSQMSSEEGADPETLNMLLKNEKCNYFVWDRQDEERRAEFADFGYVTVGDVDEYRVYRIEG
ncbi:MAG: hypothetical protein ACOX8H_03840 [Ruminococcus sp.]|jgi:hypothetical protein